MTLEEQESLGLKWVQNTFSTEPRCTTEIDLESIQRTIKESKSINATKTVQVSFLAQGALNKLYTVRTHDETLIMRVSLPVDPYWKTSSEVATLEWIRLNTTLPVPRVLTYQASRKNAIGFEWILMTKIPGKTLADSWRSIDWNAKKQLVQQLAIYLSTLFKKQLRGIGNIYPSSKPRSSHIPSSDESDGRASSNESDCISSGDDSRSDCLTASRGYELPTVERIVSMQFFWGTHKLQNVPRGPFRSSKDWIDARLSFNEHDCRSTLDNSQDEDDLEDAERTLEIIKKLKTRLGETFPDKGISEPTILCHDDLSKHNIMVDDNGKLTGVVDWECVSAVPLWKACDYPSFLKSPFRDIKPDQKGYEDDGNGRPGGLYWEHLMEYELTILRRHFMDEMRRLEQKWIKIFESSQVQKDFDTAVQNCDSEFLARPINEWLDDIASRKKLVSLRDRINGS